MTRGLHWPVGVYYVSEVLHLLRAQADQAGTQALCDLCSHTPQGSSTLYYPHLQAQNCKCSESPGVQPKQKNKNTKSNNNNHQKQKPPLTTTTKNKNKTTKTPKKPKKTWGAQMIESLVLCRQFLQCFAVSTLCTWEHHLPVWQGYFSISYSNIMSVWFVSVSAVIWRCLIIFPLDAIVSSSTPGVQQRKIQLILELHRSSGGCIPTFFYYYFLIVPCI